MPVSRYHNPFLATLNRPVRQRPCDYPGCPEAGLYKAPRSRDRLHDYYWFCLDHVRDYNAQWDFLKGLSSDEIEEQIRLATVWNRPTWPLGEAQRHEKVLRETFKRDFEGDDLGQTKNPETPGTSVGEREALAILDLEPPVDFTKIKTRYRLLVKRYHPDANGGSLEAEEKFKIVNQAFAVLRSIYVADEAT